MRNTSRMYWLTLNNTVDVSGPIDMSVLGSIDLPSSSLSNSGDSTGTFFYDHTSLYPYAGLIGSDSDDINNSLWSFNTTNDVWRSVQVQGGKISFSNNSDGVYASDPSTGTSFYTGGWDMAFNGTNNGTVEFQSFNADSPQWVFETTTTGIQGPNILKGASMSPQFYLKMNLLILLTHSGVSKKRSIRSASRFRRIPDSLSRYRICNLGMGSTTFKRHIHLRHLFKYMVSAGSYWRYP